MLDSSMLMMGNTAAGDNGHLPLKNFGLAFCPLAILHVKRKIQPAVVISGISTELSGNPLRERGPWYAVEKGLESAGVLVDQGRVGGGKFSRSISCFCFKPLFGNTVSGTDSSCLLRVGCRSLRLGLVVASHCWSLVVVACCLVVVRYHDHHVVSIIPVGSRLQNCANGMMRCLQGLLGKYWSWIEQSFTETTTSSKYIITAVNLAIHSRYDTFVFCAEKCCRCWQNHQMCIHFTVWWFDWQCLSYPVTLGWLVGWLGIYVWNVITTNQSTSSITSRIGLTIFP